MFDEPVNEPQVGLVVAVIVCGTMDYQEVALQVLYEVIGEPSRKALRFSLGSPIYRSW